MAGTTTNYAWTYPTSTDLVKDGATAIQTAIQGADTTLFTALGGNYPGMRLVKKQTIGSAVSSVTVSSAFSATYDAYRIIITGGTGSVNNDGIALTLGATVTGYNAGYSGATYTTGINTTISNNAAAAWNPSGYVQTDGIQFDVDLANPFLAKNTYFSNKVISSVNARTGAGVLLNTTSYTAFTIATSGTMTGGTIYVYGYGIS